MKGTVKGINRKGVGDHTEGQRSIGACAECERLWTAGRSDTAALSEGGVPIALEQLPGGSGEYVPGAHSAECREATRKADEAIVHSYAVFLDADNEACASAQPLPSVCLHCVAHGAANDNCVRYHNQSLWTLSHHGHTFSRVRRRCASPMAHSSV